jgi:hypothetical protein
VNINLDTCSFANTRSLFSGGSILLFGYNVNTSLTKCTFAYTNSIENGGSIYFYV